MNLLCPSCQKMLQVPDQFAGQQMRCPLCNNIFTVPGLPDAAGLPPPVPAPAPAPMEPFKVSDAPPPLPPVPDPTKSPYIPTPTPPPAPIQERDYQKLKSYWISKRCVPWIAPISMGVLFLLSFFPWVSGIVAGSLSTSLNLWSLGFGEKTGITLFVFYTLFVLFGMLASVGSLLLHLKVIPNVPGLEKFRSLIVGGFVWTAFLLLFFWELIHSFNPGVIPFGFWGLLAGWVHFLACIGVGLEVWLQMRGPAAPSPRIDIHL